MRRCTIRAEQAWQPGGHIGTHTVPQQGSGKPAMYRKQSGTKGQPSVRRSTHAPEPSVERCCTLSPHPTHTHKTTPPVREPSVLSHSSDGNGFHL